MERKKRKNKSNSGWREGLLKQPSFQLAFKNAQRSGHTNLKGEFILKARSHCQEGPVSCFFLLGLPRRQVPQPRLLTRSSGMGRSFDSTQKYWVESKVPLSVILLVELDVLCAKKNLLHMVYGSSSIVWNVSCL